MQELQQVQAGDEQRGVGARLSKALQSWNPAFSIAQTPPGAAGVEEEAAAEAVRQGVQLQRVNLDTLSSLSSMNSLDEP